jgi:hypothetical protein
MHALPVLSTLIYRSIKVSNVQGMFFSIRGTLLASSASTVLFSSFTLLIKKTTACFGIATRSPTFGSRVFILTPRTQVIIAAVSLAAYGAEREARLGRTKEAEEDADAMAQNITYAKNYAPTRLYLGLGPECSTIHK